MISTAGSLLGTRAARRLAQTGLHEIGPGLTDAEFTRVEQEYGFEFSDDHRAFLAAGLPTGSPPPEPGVFQSNTPWPDWRNGDPADLQERLSWPVDGVLFSVEHGYWHDTWGTWPNNHADAMRTARRKLAATALSNRDARWRVSPDLLRRHVGAAAAPPGYLIRRTNVRR